MRATSFAWRLLSATVLTSLAAGCAEGGISDDELNGELNNDGDRDGGRSPTRDAGRDARATSNTDDDDDDAPTTGGSTGGSTGGTIKRDGGTSTGGGSTGGGTKDAGGSTGGGGGSGLGTPIKCPSSMVCNNSLSTVLSLLDPSIPSGTNLCAMSGGFLPMAASCTTDSECSSARLTTAKCTGGSCIQPCNP